MFELLPWTALNPLRTMADRVPSRAIPLRMTRFGISHFSVDSFLNLGLAYDSSFDCIADIVSICEKIQRKQNENNVDWIVENINQLPICGICIVWGGEREHCLVVVCIFQCLPIVWIVNGIKCFQEILRNTDAGLIREKWCLRCWRLGVIRFNIKTYLRR